MRHILTLLTAAVWTAAFGQMGLRHEVIFDGVAYLEGQLADAMVSDDGIPLFRAARLSAPYLHTYYYKTDLNALYFSVPSVGGQGIIGRTGKVAFTARTATTYHVIGNGRDYFAEVEVPRLASNLRTAPGQGRGRLRGHASTSSA
ncbi:MAG: hypothetical protein AMXMBFR61_16350 [Fimbriimonadales bacterium]